MRLTRRLAACCVLAGLTLLAQAAEAPRGQVVVLAASSLTDVLNDIAGRYERETGAHVALSYAASSALARQIEAGAPADLFFSADTDWMDYLQKHELIQTPSRRNIVGNRLVLIAPHVDLGRDCVWVHAVNNMLSLLMGLSTCPELQQVSRLDFE